MRSRSYSLINKSFTLKCNPARVSEDNNNKSHQKQILRSFKDVCVLHWQFCDALVTYVGPWSVFVILLQWNNHFNLSFTCFMRFTPVNLTSNCEDFWNLNHLLSVAGVNESLGFYVSMLCVFIHVSVVPYHVVTELPANLPLLITTTAVRWR